jgi:4-amino-4-deoxy-L-arabinose transferase-like glycosyltransferase
MLVAVGITLLALALRVAYFLGADVAVPVRGDVLEYWNYAWNLAQHGVFSSAPPGAAVQPDAWRAPGYAFFLSLFMHQGDPERALQLAQWTQILLGTSLAPLTIVFARRFLSPAASLGAGFAVAAWPHLVVFSSTLLSETLFCLLLLLSAWFADIADRADRARTLAWALASGLASGAAALVNPLWLLFPPLLALVLALRSRGREVAAFLLSFVLVAGAWQWRNAAIADDGAARRARVNLVQGSWPEYHAAWQDRGRNEIARAYANAIEDEIRTIESDPRAGRRRILERIAADPGRMAQWYLLQKPWLLWSWSVRIGWGDIYFLETERSPFDRVPVFRAIRAMFVALNPEIFALALAGALVLLARLLRRPRERDLPLAPLWLAMFFCYVTAVHAVLQAEPRYAVAYRPFEVLLAFFALEVALRWTLRRRTGMVAG